MGTEVDWEGVRSQVDLQAIESIFDADGIDDLVDRPPAEAGALYALLLECARGEAGECFEAICRVAERRSVTPAYLIDRADVLVASADARQAGDLYRILGVPPLASEEEIRARWREAVKRCHPDLAGSGSSKRFRAIKAAYNVLGDPERRAEYERLWRETVERIEVARAIADTVEIEQPPDLGQRAGRALRAIAARMGGFLGVPEEAQEHDGGAEAERGKLQAGADEAPPATVEAARDLGQGGHTPGAKEPGQLAWQLEAKGPGADEGNVDKPRVAGKEREISTNELTWLEEEAMQDVLRRTEAVFEAVRGLDQRLKGAGFEGVAAIARLFEQLHSALDTVSVDEIDSTLADVDRARQTLDAVGLDLGRLRRLKLSLGDGASSGR